MLITQIERPELVFVQQPVKTIERIFWLLVEILHILVQLWVYKGHTCGVGLQIVLIAL